MMTLMMSDRLVQYKTVQDAFKGIALNCMKSFSNCKETNLRTLRQRKSSYEASAPGASKSVTSHH